jgi:hypothetical protein
MTEDACLNLSNDVKKNVHQIIDNIGKEYKSTPYDCVTGDIRAYRMDEVDILHKDTYQIFATNQKDMQRAMDEIVSKISNHPQNSKWHIEERQFVSVDGDKVTIE